MDGLSVAERGKHILQKNLRAFLFALVSGMAGVLLVHFYLKNERDKIMDGMAPVEAAIASGDLSEGTVLQEGDIDKKAFPLNFFHEKGVRYSDFTVIRGHALKYPVKKGELFLWSGIRGNKLAEGLSEKIINGKRGIALSVDDVTGISGLIQPGNHIDILGTFASGIPIGDKQEVKPGEATVMLLQNVPVIAAGTRVADKTGGPISGDGGGGTLTVMVSPEEASLLVLAQQKGKLTMILRNDHDQGDLFRPPQGHL